MSDFDEDLRVLQQLPVFSSDELAILSNGIMRIATETKGYEQMVGVASRADSEELYHLSGWNGQYWWWSIKHPHPDGSACYDLVGEHDAPFANTTYPAYDVGYLLKRLPAVTLTGYGSGKYKATWKDHADHVTIGRESRANPANALCRLAMALFEAGILKPEND